MVNRQCGTCNKKFQVPQYIVKIGKGRFCSKKCFYESAKGKPPWNKGKKYPQISGEKHYLWGRHHSVEARKKMSAIKIGKRNTNGFKKGHTPWNKGKPQLNITGEKHPKWKGDEVGYRAIHDWVNKYKGKPKECLHCCIKCDKKQLHWANKDHKYKRILSDYISLCPSCHKKYDIKFNY